MYKENGGHGEAINTGIRNASGLYIKVVDSDDWVDANVYEKEGTKNKKIMKYENVLPQETTFTWDDIKNFRKGQYILMHSVMYRTRLLRDCGLELPKHTFYVDNL